MIQTTRVAIIREGKIPNDKRTPFTPAQAAELVRRFPQVELCVQTSKWRCYSDDEYRDLNVPVVDDISSCDILLGIKEVPVSALLPGKTYLFFSHTLKKQAHNQKLLKEILRKKIRIIDYEALRDAHGVRVIAFGKYAGMVGAYNALLLFGKKFNQYRIKRAFECATLEGLQSELRKIKLPAINIALTGGGRVGQGAAMILDSAGIMKVAAQEYLTTSASGPRYVQLSSADYYVKLDGSSFDRTEFHEHPELFTSSFRKFLKQTDVLIAGAYWDPRAPVLFTADEARQSDFRIRVVADISCDLDGPIPTTKKASSIHDPFYDYNRETGALEQPFSSENNVTVMAIDNLPCEIPREASAGFGEVLLEQVMPRLLADHFDPVIANATIAENGALTKPFAYLQDYVDG